MFKVVLLTYLMTKNADGSTSAIVDTLQSTCYSQSEEIACPKRGEPFYGQDGTVSTVVPYLVASGNGVIGDQRTGLQWTQARQEKMKLGAARQAAAEATIGGYSDWRLPTVTELYSLIDFRGVTPLQTLESRTAIQYLSDLFEWEWGDAEGGERLIDCQYASDTEYVSTTFNGAATMFGVNFADGRIKGYPSATNQYMSIFVRGTSDYGVHDFIDQQNDIVLDQISGLMWMQQDAGQVMDWPSALEYCDDLELGGYSDFRLPDAKELQALIDYDRSPDTTNSPAIDPIFQSTSFTNEAGATDWNYYWTSTTHLDGLNLGESAVYICFGRCLGYVNGNYLDVHGAGSQRSDPKTGTKPDPTNPRSPQGDIIRIDNAVRCVRGGEATFLDDATLAPTPEATPAPTPEATPAPTPEPTPEATLAPTPESNEESVCQDDDSWHHINKEKRDCAWVRQRTERRCSFKSTEGVLASDACALSCGTCTLEGCGNDETFRLGRSGHKSQKGCDYISHSTQRCTTKGLVLSDDTNLRHHAFAYAECRAACFTCPSELPACTEPNTEWRVKGKKHRNKGCAWIGENPSQRCKLKGKDHTRAFRSCPQECGLCEE